MEEQRLELATVQCGEQLACVADTRGEWMDGRASLTSLLDALNTLCMRVWQVPLRLSLSVITRSAAQGFAESEAGAVLRALDDIRAAVTQTLARIHPNQLPVTAHDQQQLQQYYSACDALVGSPRELAMVLRVAYPCGACDAPRRLMSAQVSICAAATGDAERVGG